MTQLPTGTVTFLFTDIEGSTRLLRELGDAYADVLEEHRRVLREAFARNGGVEFGTEGDAFFVAFARASDAVNAAGDAQQALADTAVRVRMGIHTGEPVVTNDDYVGVDVHCVARIAAAAHGGQVLLSEQAARLVDVRLRDLGVHRFKDMEAPERVYQLGDASFPPLRTSAQRALPRAATALVGREREAAEVAAMVREDGAVVVTLVGPGGVGKTRLALQVAHELAEQFADGSVWVPLGTVADPALVVPTIRQALGSDSDAARPLADVSVLLVLDELERVVAAAPDIAALLREAPRTRVLATSREPLRLSMERQYPVAPLTDVEAVELFRRRAVAVRPTFEPDDAVAEICRRLDGLPLAIELAAARVNVLPPREIAKRLDRRLPLLAGGPADAPARHRTLRSTIEWSYDVLDDREQTAFTRLAVFASCSLDAAERVAEVDLETLSSLVEKSLVQEHDGRFTMLQIVREFARDRLEDLGEGEAIARRHATYFVELGETRAVRSSWSRKGNGSSACVPSTRTSGSRWRGHTKPARSSWACASRQH
jgi:predicted ATPase/class 3 adenylate cyclase